MTAPDDGLRAALAEDAALLHHFVHPDIAFEDCEGARCVRRRNLLAATNRDAEAIYQRRAHEGRAIEAAEGGTKR